MPRRRDRGVLDRGLASGFPLIWQTDAFALATGWDDSAGRYAGLWLPGDSSLAPPPTDALLLVQPKLAEAQRDKEIVVDPSPGPGPVPPPGPGPEPGPGPKPPVRTRFLGATTLGSTRHTLDFKQIADEVLAHLDAPGIELTIRLEIEAVDRDGFDEATVRVVRENATTLKFDQVGFESD